MTIWLNVETFRQLCFDLAAQSTWGEAEPIPHFDTRFPGRLESCLDTPRQTFDGQELYPTLVEQAAMLFYLLNKNHPFANGNKRIALTALLVFLFLNGRWLAAGQEEMFQLAMMVAASQARERDAVLASVRQFIESHMVTPNSVFATHNVLSLDPGAGQPPQNSGDGSLTATGSSSSSTDH
jgi:death on curing protein